MMPVGVTFNFCMSIVCGAIKNGEVAIAADTQTSCGSLKLSALHMKNAHKLFTFQNCVIGFVGWNALWNILEHLLQRDDLTLNFSTRTTIFDSLLQLQQCLKDDYFLETKEEDEQPVQSNQLEILIINPNGLFQAGSLREVDEFHTYWAIGSGRQLALGAMHAIYAHSPTAEAIARTGATAAAEFDSNCSLPIESKVMPLQQA
jgi:ATP-dependent HslUV protease subunit HslV